MGKTAVALSSLFIALLHGTASHACTMSMPPIWLDMPILIMQDGSFKWAGEELWDSKEGSAPFDVGNGKVGQKLYRGDGNCNQMEFLLVVDCISVEHIVIEGLDDQKGLISPYSTSVDLLYPPKGKIRLTESVTISDLAEVSGDEGYTFTTDLQSALETKKKRNRYNPFNGCKIFYPDSPGAKTK
jgi:hypothetical protein